MTDENQNQQQGSTQDTARFASMTVHHQYVKDFSFENPNAPETMAGGQSQPALSANVNMQAKQLDKDQALYEVTLNVTATAKREEKVLFMAEIDYGLLLSVPNVPEEHRHPLLLIEGPKLAFPFVRQILANAIQNGGYPPLLLNPVNFEELYKQQYLAQQAAAQDAVGTA
tara:strand:- start:361 stop:870 length:510 start_codon:yes stop_codon:yes gene_type:complete